MRGLAVKLWSREAVVMVDVQEGERHNGWSDAPPGQRSRQWAGGAVAWCRHEGWPFSCLSRRFHNVAAEEALASQCKGGLGQGRPVMKTPTGGSTCGIALRTIDSDSSQWCARETPLNRPGVAAQSQPVMTPLSSLAVPALADAGSNLPNTAEDIIIVGTSPQSNCRENSILHHCRHI